MHTRVYMEGNGIDDGVIRAFQEEVDSILQAFDRAKEWADLIRALQRLSKVLSHVRRAQPSQIPELLTLSKRLAQCLNPALPSGVHLKSLLVYEHLLRLLGADSMLHSAPYLAAGVFPLGSHASLQVRPVLLSLLQTYFVPAARSAPQILKGLVLAVLPALEDTGRDTADAAVRIFHSLPRKHLLPSLWESVLSCPDHRTAALTFLVSVSETNLDHPQGPVVTTRSVPALVAALSDVNHMTVRTALDVLEKHLNLNSSDDAVSGKGDVALVRAALRTMLRGEVALTRRVLRWVFGDDEIKSGNTVRRLVQDALYAMLIDAEKGTEEEKNIFKLCYTLYEQVDGIKQWWLLLVPPSGDYSNDLEKDSMIFLKMLERVDAACRGSHATHNASTSAMKMMGFMGYDNIWGSLSRVPGNLDANTLRLMDGLLELLPFSRNKESEDTVNEGEEKERGLTLVILLRRVLEQVKISCRDNQHGDGVSDTAVHFAVKVLAAIPVDDVPQEFVLNVSQTFLEFLEVFIDGQIENSRLGRSDKAETFRLSCLFLMALLTRWGTNENVKGLIERFLQLLLHAAEDAPTETSLVAISWILDAVSKPEFGLKEVVSPLVSEENVSSLVNALWCHLLICENNDVSTSNLSQDVAMRLVELHSWAPSVCRRVLARRMSPSSDDARKEFTRFSIIWGLVDDLSLRSSPEFLLECLFQMMDVVGEVGGKQRVKNSHSHLWVFARYWLRNALTMNIRRIVDPLLLAILDKEELRKPRNSERSGINAFDLVRVHHFLCLLDAMLDLYPLEFSRGISSAELSQNVSRIYHVHVLSTFERSDVEREEKSARNALVSSRSDYLGLMCSLCFTLIRSFSQTEPDVSCKAASVLRHLCQCCLHDADVEGDSSFVLWLIEGILYCLRDIFTFEGCESSVWSIQVELLSIIQLLSPFVQFSSSIIIESSTCDTWISVLVDGLTKSCDIGVNRCALGLFEEWARSILCSLPALGSFMTKAIGIFVPALCNVMNDVSRSVEKRKLEKVQCEHAFAAIVTIYELVRFVSEKTDTAPSPVGWTSLSSPWMRFTDVSRSPDVKARSPNVRDLGTQGSSIRGFLSGMLHVFSGDTGRVSPDGKVANSGRSSPAPIQNSSSMDETIDMMREQVHLICASLARIWDIAMDRSSSFEQEKRSEKNMRHSENKQTDHLQRSVIHLFDYIFVHFPAEFLTAVIELDDKEDEGHGSVVVDMLCRSTACGIDEVIPVLIALAEKRGGSRVTHILSLARVFLRCGKKFEAMQTTHTAVLALTRFILSSKQDASVYRSTILFLLSLFLLLPIPGSSGALDKRQRKELIDSCFKVCEACVSNVEDSNTFSSLGRYIPELLYSMYDDEEKERDRSIVTLISSELLIVPKKNNPFRLTCVGLFLQSALAVHPEMFTPSIRKDIYEYFLNPNFKLDTSRSSLSVRAWRSVIGAIFLSDRSLFTDLLGRYTSGTQNVLAPAAVGGLLLGGASSLTAQQSLNRVRMLRATSFALYASDVDTILPVLPSVLERLVESLKYSDIDKNVEVYERVLFCFRMVIARAPASSLTSFWPTILAELIRVLESYKTVPPSVLLEVVKCIDFSLIVIPQKFQLYEWMFLGETELSSSENQPFVPYLRRLCNEDIDRQTVPLSEVSPDLHPRPYISVPRSVNVTLDDIILFSRGLIQHSQKMRSLRSAPIDTHYMDELLGIDL